MTAKIVDITRQLDEKRREIKRRRSWADYMRANHCRDREPEPHDNLSQPAEDRAHIPKSNDGTTPSAPDRSKGR